MIDHDELLAPDKEALVDLIVRLYERVTELAAGYKPNRAERHWKKRGPEQGLSTTP